MRQKADVTKAGSLRGLPAACLVLLLTLVSCGEASKELPAEGLELWSVPELPTGVEMEVNGRSVDPEVLRGYLLPLWAEHWDDRAELAEATRAFFAEPRALFTPLVRGILLLEEAERRWPVIAADELAAFDAEMRRATGAIYEAMERRLGADGMRAHQEREIRKRQILAAFGAEAEPVSDDEVFRQYEWMLSKVEDPTALAQSGVNYESSAPLIRADLERTRAVARQESWIDERFPAAKVHIGLPDGRTHSW